jgi:hypothetical protein
MKRSINSQGILEMSLCLAKCTFYLAHLYSSDWIVRRKSRGVEGKLFVVLPGYEAQPSVDVVRRFSAPVGK